MYRILSPDGFDIECDAVYRDPDEVTAALSRFLDRYKPQGYYSTGNRERISLTDLPGRCTIIAA